MFVLNSRRNAATGVPPSQLLMGTQLPRPGEWAHPEVHRPPPQDAVAARRQRIRQARTNQAVFQRQLYPQPRGAPRRFRRGEMVLVRAFPDSRPPLGVAWQGPHPVTAIKGNGVYEVDRNGTQFLIHVDDLRPAPGPVPDHAEIDPLARPDDDDPGDAEDEVASQASDGPDRPGLDPPHHPPGELGDGVGDAPDEPAPGSGRLLAPTVPEPQPGPSGLQRHTVLVEDVTDDEEEGAACHLGVPIIGLWP